MTAATMLIEEEFSAATALTESAAGKAGNRRQRTQATNHD